MVTGYPQLLVGPQSTADARRMRIGRNWVVRSFQRLGQMLCGLSGHDRVRHFEHNRVSLVCATCGHVSPGWELSAPLPQVRYAGDPERHQLRGTPRMVSARRVA